jgi:hypothetical protein
MRVVMFWRGNHRNIRRGKDVANDVLAGNKRSILRMGATYCKMLSSLDLTNRGRVA